MLFHEVVANVLEYNKTLRTTDVNYYECLAIRKYYKELQNSLKKHIKKTTQINPTAIYLNRHNSGISGYIRFSSKGLINNDHILVSWDICNPKVILARYDENIATIQIEQIGLQLNGFFELISELFLQGGSAYAE